MVGWLVAWLDTWLSLEYEEVNRIWIDQFNLRDLGVAIFLNEEMLIGHFQPKEKWFG